MGTQNTRISKERGIPGRLIRAGKITYTANDIIAYALKVTLNDISESLNTEEGKRYFETQEGKA